MEAGQSADFGRSRTRSGHSLFDSRRRWGEGVAVHRGIPLMGVASWEVGDDVVAFAGLAHVSHSLGGKHRDDTKDIAEIESVPLDDADDGDGGGTQTSGPGVETLELRVDVGYWEAGASGMGAHASPD